MDLPHFWAIAGQDIGVYGLKNGIVLLAILALAGCSSGTGLLDSKSAVPSAARVPVGNSLAMPPDLQLAEERVLQQVDADDADRRADKTCRQRGAGRATHADIGDAPRREP